MNLIGATIRNLRELNDWTQEELADRVGMSRVQITKRERGDVRVRPSERKRFADAFGMTVSEFDSEWRKLQRISQTKGGNGIPVINRAPAGNVVDFEEYGVDSGQGYDYIEYGQLAQDEHLFAVVVTGDSMEPSLHSGEIAVFRPHDRERSNGAFNEGNIYFVRFAPEYEEQGCTIARVWVRDGEIYLAKDNPKYAPRTVPREMISQLAEGVELRRPINRA